MTREKRFAAAASGGARAPEPSPLASPRRTALERALRDPALTLVVVEGPAGCGKTHSACAPAALALAARGHVVVLRPTVGVSGEQMGFLPGGVSDKMAPWAKPVVEHLERAAGRPVVTDAVAAGRVEALPLAYARGRDLRRAFIIADEMQNSTPAQMLALLTRVGDGSRLVITGDLQQSDLGPDNGLRDLLRRLEARPDAEIARRTAVVRMNAEDVVRGDGFVRDVIALYAPDPDI